MTEPWLGHWDGCCVAYSDICDCDPDNPVNLAEAGREVVEVEITDEVDRKYVFNGDEAAEVWMDRP